MLRPHTMLLFLQGTSKLLWAGAERAPLCLQVSAANAFGFRAPQGYSEQESPFSPSCRRTCLTQGYLH